MNKLTLFIALLISIAQQAQVLPTFQYAYQFSNPPSGSPYDMLTGVKATPDGRFIAIGRFRNSYYINNSNIANVIAKMDSLGQVVWATAPLEHHAILVAATSDNGAAVLGTHTDSAVFTLCLARYNSSGTMQWTREFHAPFAGYLSNGGLLQTADGGFMISTNVLGNNIMRAVFFKTDSLGQVEWQQSTAPDQTSGHDGYEIAAHPQGYLVSSGNGVLSLLEETGDPVWLRYYQDASGNIPSFTRLAVDPGGSFLSNTTSPGGLARFDSDGNTQWSKSYALPGLINFAISGFSRLYDGYVVYGNAFDTTVAMNGYNSPVLFKIDTTGAVVWARRYGTQGWRSHSSAMTVLRNGSIVMAGYIQTIQNPNYRGWIGCTDSNGNIACYGMPATVNAYFAPMFTYTPAQLDTFTVSSNNFPVTHITPGAQVSVDCSTVGIDAPSLSDALHIRYGSGQVFIDLPQQSGVVQLSVYGMTGALVKRWSTSDSVTQLDSSNLPGGVYLLQAHNGKKEWSERILVR